jgi:hypothetical protein
MGQVYSWSARQRGPGGASAQAPSVWVLPCGIRPDRQRDGNTVIFSAPKGLIVMDTGRHAWHREATLAFARAEKRPIVAIVNSHWYLERRCTRPSTPGPIACSAASAKSRYGMVSRTATSASRSVSPLRKGMPPYAKIIDFAERADRTGILVFSTAAYEDGFATIRERRHYKVSAADVAKLGELAVATGNWDFATGDWTAMKCTCIARSSTWSGSMLTVIVIPRLISAATTRAN